MKTGGYVIIDFKNSLIDPDAGGHLTGIYDKVENAYGGKKATLVSGLNNDGSRIEDFYTKFVLRENIFYGLISLENSVATYVKVESDDDISIVTESVGGGGGEGLATYVVEYESESPIDLPSIIPMDAEAPFVVKISNGSDVDDVILITNASINQYDTNIFYTLNGFGHNTFTGHTQINWGSTNNILNVYQYPYVPDTYLLQNPIQESSWVDNETEFTVYGFYLNDDAVGKNVSLTPNGKSKVLSVWKRLNEYFSAGVGSGFSFMALMPNSDETGSVPYNVLVEITAQSAGNTTLKATRYPITQ